MNKFATSAFLLALSRSLTTWRRPFKTQLNTHLAQPTDILVGLFSDFEWKLEPRFVLVDDVVEDGSDNVFTRREAFKTIS
jgi:hypothetical protein